MAKEEWSLSDFTEQNRKCLLLLLNKKIVEILNIKIILTAFMIRILSNFLSTYLL